MFPTSEVMIIWLILVFMTFLLDAELSISHEESVLMCAMITNVSEKVKDLKSKAKQMFEVVMRDLPDPIEADPNLVNTSKTLVSLARTWPEPLSDQQRKDLEAMCRKVHIAKKVMAIYAPGWKKVPEPVPLSLPYWSALIAILLGHSHLDNVNNKDARGLAFKFLNAALASLDLAESQGTIPYFSELQGWAEEVLENLFYSVER